MASADTLCKKLLNVKNTVVESHDFYSDKDGVVHLRIKARPSAWHKDDCPFCSRRCPGYDRPVKNRKCELPEKLTLDGFQVLIPGVIGAEEIHDFLE